MTTAFDVAPKPPAHSLWGVPPSRSSLTRDAMSPLACVFQALPLPVVVLAGDRTIVATSDPSHKALSCLALSFGRVTGFAGRASESFERLFSRARLGSRGSAVVGVPADGRLAVWRVHAAALRLMDDRASPTVLLMVEPPPQRMPSLEPLRDLLGITAAEARVLAHLLQDMAPREIADRLGLSVATVRCHLKSLFSKTCTRRQSELVALAWASSSFK